MKNPLLTEAYWQNIFKSFSDTLKLLSIGLPSVSEIAQRKADPYRVLISTVISLRTKDAVTIAASERLFERADTPSDMVTLTEKEIGDLIYPAGFYRRKAMHILAISNILIDSFNGKVPPERESLISLPGVGVKTANLTLNLGFGIDAICVDTHVHRISNRCGWITTKTPEQSEKALEKIMPRRFWIPLNELLVTYGQQICTPVSPRCSQCPITAACPKIGVTTSR